MKNRRNCKDRCPKNRKEKYPNGRYSILTPGTVPAVSIWIGA